MNKNSEFLQEFQQLLDKYKARVWREDGYDGTRPDQFNIYGPDLAISNYDIADMDRGN